MRHLPDLSWIGPLIGDNVQFGGKGRSARPSAGPGGSDIDRRGARRGAASGLGRPGGPAGKREAGCGPRRRRARDQRTDVRRNPRVAPTTSALSKDSTPTGRSRCGRSAASRCGRSTGSIGMQATQLPVLQRADRWMVVSGTGGITFTPQRADLYAKLTVEAPTSTSTRCAPAARLPNDVVVTRAGRQRRPGGPPST